MPSGKMVCSFSLATSRFYKDDQGARQEQTDFHEVVAFGGQAETIAKYCHKGDLLLVEGRLQTRSWEAKDGTKKYKTEVIVENLQLGPKRQSAAPEPQGYDDGQTRSEGLGSLKDIPV